MKFLKYAGGVVAVVIVGLAIDGKGAIKALGTLGVAFATGGISVLVKSAKEKVDTATGGNPCAEARTWHTKKS